MFAHNINLISILGSRGSDFGQQAQTADVKAARELVQAHASEMADLLNANASGQRRMQQMEVENAGLHAKLAKADDALLKLRSKFRYGKPVSRHFAREWIMLCKLVMQ